MNKLKKYAGLLNDEAPEDHFLAYITPNERDMLIKSGGQETATASGIFSYQPPGGGETSLGSGAAYSGGGHRGGGPDRDPPPPHERTKPPKAPSGDGRSTALLTQYNAPLAEQTAFQKGEIFEEYEYLEPDKDHWKATQKAIKEGQKSENYQADWNDWTKEQQDTYQLEMNKLKGTTDKNYSFYKGNEGTTNLSFSEHWKDVVITDPVLKFSPMLRLLVSAGRTLKENLTTDYGTWKYGAKEGTGSGTPFDSGGWFGKIFNKDGTVKTNLTNDQINDAYNQATPDLAPMIGGTAPQVSQAAKWYANLGNTGTNQFQFSFANELAAAKTKQASILGNQSAVGWLAVNQSPFYNFLKEKKLDKGIL
jgi:hypothetical protein